MKIKDMKVYRVKIPLKKKFVIATGSQDHYEGILVRIQSTDRTYGWGEGVAMRRVLGETNDFVCSDLMNLKKRIIGSSVDPTYIEEFFEKIKPKSKGASAAIDSALHDLVGKKYRIPLEKMLGGHKRRMKTCITIGIGDIKWMLALASEYTRNGFDTLKIKIGTDPKEDVEKIGMIREAVGRKVKIRVDANQGYSKEDAVKVINDISDYRIEFVEQPVPMGDLEGMKYVRDNVSVPIMADESCTDASSLIRIASNEYADMVNLKLMKMGGVRELRKCADAAESMGILCQMGCVIESVVGISCGTRCAMAFPAVKYADLDGHFDIQEKIASGGIVTRDGVHYPVRGGGLGIKVNMRKIEPFSEG